MKRWRRTALALACLGAVAAAATVTAGASAAPQAGIKISFANSVNSVAIFKQVGDGVVRAAKKAGFELKAYDNKFDGPAALDNARLMVQDKPDVIIEYNLVQDMGTAVSNILEQSKVPCVAINAPTAGCAWANLSNRDAGTATGPIVAKEAMKRGWKASDTVVLLLQLAGGGTEINDSVAYFYITAARTMGLAPATRSQIGPSTTKLGSNLIQIDGKAALEPAYDATKNILQTIGKDKHLIVFGVNDDSALGAWRAITQAGRQQSTLIAGLGATTEGVKQLRTNPQWVAQADVFLDFWGQFAVAMAAAVKDGKTPPALTRFPQTVMTKATVGQYYKAGQKIAYHLPPLHPSAAYLKPYLKVFGNVEGVS